MTDRPIYEFRVHERATQRLLGAGTGYRTPRQMGREMSDVIRVTQSWGYEIDEIVPECRAVEGGESRPVADAEAVARGDAIQGGKSRPITQAEAISAGGVLMEWNARRKVANAN